MLSLATLADEDGVCSSGRAAIAEHCRIKDPKSLQRILKALQSDGEIICFPGRGRGRPSVYIITVGLSHEGIAEILARRFAFSSEEIAGILNGDQSKGYDLTPFYKGAAKKRGADDPLLEPEKGAESPPITTKGGQSTPFYNGTAKKRRGDDPLLEPEKGAESPPITTKGGQSTPFYNGMTKKRGADAPLLEPEKGAESPPITTKGGQFAPFSQPLSSPPHPPISPRGDLSSQRCVNNINNILDGEGERNNNQGCKSEIGADPPSPSLVDALCDALQKNLALLSSKKRKAVLDAAKTLEKTGYSAEQILAFPEFWSTVKPLGARICATQPHISQVLELMPQCAAWLERREDEKRRREKAIARLEELGRQRPQVHRPASNVEPKILSAWQECAFMFSYTLTRNELNQQFLDGIPVEFDGRRLTIALASPEAVEWATYRLNGRVSKRISQIADMPIEVRYTTVQETDLAPP